LNGLSSTERHSPAGVTGAAGIVERRKPSRQLRMGVAKIEIEIV
jgi:hypothetical protein